MSVNTLCDGCKNKVPIQHLSLFYCRHYKTRFVPGIENCSFYEEGNFMEERDKLLREFEREAIGIVRSLPEGNAKKRIESLVDEYAEKWY